MNRFYEQSGYTFGYGNFLLLSYSSFLSPLLYATIREAQREGYSFVLAKKEDKIVILSWNAQVVSRIKAMTDYPAACTKKVLEDYPDVDSFIVTVSKGRLELIPRLPQLEFCSISTAELCAIIAEEQGTEIHMVPQSVGPQPNMIGHL